MREGTLQKRNTLMHRQLKSFETSLQQASEYYNPDDLYNLIAPIIPPGVQILSFDGLQRIVSQSKMSKGGRKVKSQPSLYLRAFLQDFLRYLDHLQQLKDNFNERIYAILFEFYYQIAFKNVRTNNEIKKPVQPDNLLKALDLPKHAKSQKQYSKEFVEELTVDCEDLSEIMSSLQILVRNWGRLCEEEDIDISLFHPDSQVDLGTYPNCDAFEAIIRYVPDVLHKGKMAHNLAYDWWCLGEKIHRKLTGHWKPKGASPKKWLQVKTVLGVTTKSQSDASRDMTPATKVVSRASTYHEHCAPAKKDNAWVHPSSNPMKVTKKDPPIHHTKKQPRKTSRIPRKVNKPRNENRRKISHQMIQTQKRVRDASTSPLIAIENSLKGGDTPGQHTYSDCEFEEDEQETRMERDRGSELLLRHREEQEQDLDERIGYMNFDIDLKVRQLEEKVHELKEVDHLHSQPQKLSTQVERAIADIESLQNGLQEIEIEKNRLKWNLRESRRDAVGEDGLKRDIEALNDKLRQMAGLAKVNTYRHKLLSSDMNLALELRGTFSRYNDEVKGKISLLERLIEEERKEQAKLEEEIAELRATVPELDENALHLESITPASTTPDSGRVNTSKESLIQRGGNYDQNDVYGEVVLDWGDDTPDISEDEIDDFLSKADRRGQQTMIYKKNKIVINKSAEEMANNKLADGKMGTGKPVVGKAQRPYQPAKQEAALSPLDEESSLRDSTTSLRSLKSGNKRPDSPSPTMYESKREVPIKQNLDPILKLPKISEKASIIQPT